jgi:hypothetical protein
VHDIEDRSKTEVDIAHKNIAEENNSGTSFLKIQLQISNF